MFLSKNNHRLIKHFHVVERSFFGAFTFIMNNSGFGEIVVFITALRNPVRKVDVFSIHKKGLVKQTDFIQCFLSHKHKRAGQYFYFVNFIFIEVGEMVLPELFRFGKQFRQPEHFVESHPGCGQSAF